MTRYESALKKISERLAAPRLEIKCDTELHKYTVGSYAAPSVTAIIGSIFAVPAYIATSYEYARATLIGAAVHASIHYDLQNDLSEDSITQEVMGYVNAERKFVKQYGLHPAAIECPVGSILPLYAGRIDTLMVDHHGLVWLLDWKTGIKLDTVKMQLEAYAEGLKHTYGIQVHYTVPVYLEEDGTFSVPGKADRDPFDFQAFCAAITIRKWKTKEGRKI